MRTDDEECQKSGRSTGKKTTIKPDQSRAVPVVSGDEEKKEHQQSNTRQHNSRKCMNEWKQWRTLQSRTGLVRMP